MQKNMRARGKSFFRSFAGGTAALIYKNRRSDEIRRDVIVDKARDKHDEVALTLSQNPECFSGAASLVLSDMFRLVFLLRCPTVLTGAFGVLLRYIFKELTGESVMCSPKGTRTMGDATIKADDDGHKRMVIPAKAWRNFMMTPTIMRQICGSHRLQEKKSASVQQVLAVMMRWLLPMNRHASID